MWTEDQKLFIEGRLPIIFEVVGIKNHLQKLLEENNFPSSVISSIARARNEIDGIIVSLVEELEFDCMASEDEDEDNDTD